ncbi:MAG: hypothetical protein U9N44_01425 [Chloroflexota bacterium]|nr:hypothetical protein [Chloroflexota bacterium]
MSAKPGVGELTRYETAVVLRDGATLHLRPVYRGDERRLMKLVQRMSRNTIYLRFHHIITQLSKEEARRFCDVDYDNEFALVGTVGGGVFSNPEMSLEGQ